MSTASSQACASHAAELSSAAGSLELGALGPLESWGQWPVVSSVTDGASLAVTHVSELSEVKDG